MADITYFETKEDGSLLSDAYSKRIMGMSWRRRSQAGNTAMGGAPLRQGLQQYTDVVKSSNGQGSMTQSGSPYDNAVADRISGILRDEFGLGGRLKNLEEAVEVCNEKQLALELRVIDPERDARGSGRHPVRAYKNDPHYSI